MATIRMVTEIKTLPMDEQERVIVPPNRRPFGRMGSQDTDVLTPSQVFTLIRQTAFGEVGDNTGYSQYMVGDVFIRDLTTMWGNHCFHGVQLSAGLYPPYYRRVMVKKDGTFSIRDLRNKVVELQAIDEKERARRKTLEQQINKEIEENIALLDSVAEGRSQYDRHPVPGVEVRVDNGQEKTVSIQLRGITVDEAKTLIHMYANKRLPINQSQDESEAK